MLAEKSTLQLDEVVRLLRESQQIMDVDKSSEYNFMLITKGEKEKNFSDQYGIRFQSRYMTIFECHYYEDFDQCKLNKKYSWRIYEA